MKISLSQIELNFKESAETNRSPYQRLKDWLRKFWEVVEL